MALKLGIFYIFAFILLTTPARAESPRTMDAYIQSELVPFSEITLEQLAATQSILVNLNRAHMWVNFNSGHFNYYTPPLSFVYQLRVDGFIRLFKKLAPNLPNMDFIIVLDDGFDQELLGKDSAPIFCIAKLKMQDRILCIPEIHSYPTVDRFYSQVSKAATRLPWEHKLEIAFWRGSTTGGYYDFDSWSNTPRSQLVTFSKTAPQLLNCGFHNFVQGTSEGEIAMRNQGFFADPFDPTAQIKYKYLIAIDGNSFASALKWQLFSGSVVLKNESDWVEWFEYALVPFQHYVPYKLDFSDLLEKIDWLKKNDSAAKQIATNASYFANSQLTSKNIELYVHQLLVAYSKLRSTTY